MPQSDVPREDRAELGAEDIDDLWARWFVPIFGTGRQDGWIDRTGVAEAGLAEHIAGGFAEMVSALCWLAIRPGAARRERFMAWQGALAAALDRGVLDATDDCAEYVPLIVGHDVTRSQIETDLLGAIEFMDDRLWCAKTADELELDALELEAGTLGEDSVKAVVRGVTEPLQDPRLARLVVALRAYRRVDAVVVFSADFDWRIVIEPGEPTYFLPQFGGEPLESAALSTEDLDQLAGGQRVLADLFPRVTQVA